MEMSVTENTLIEGNKLARETADNFLKFAGKHSSFRNEFIDQLLNRSHNTTQQSAIQLMLQCIEEVAKGNHSIDLRNADSIAVCKQMVAGFKSLANENSNEFAPSEWLRFI